MYPYNLIEDNIIIVVYENGGYDLEPGFYQDESYTLFVIKVLPVITFMLHYKLPWNNKFSQCVIQDSVQIGGLRKMTTLDGRRTMKAIHKEVFSDSTLKTRILAMKMK